jgi:WD40 repeat protein
MSSLADTRMEGHSESIESPVLSADGRRLVSGSNDRTVRVWDLESGECVRVFTTHRTCDLTSGMDIVYTGAVMSFKP